MMEQATQPPRRVSSWTPGSMVTLGVGVACLTAAAILFFFQLAGHFDTLVFSTPETGTAFNVSAILNEGTPPPVATPTGTPPSSAPIARIVIPKIGVDAKIVVKGIGPDGVMEVPDNAYDVAWYDFTARPGWGGNAVFSGHVDFRGVGPAVFWNLGKLEPEDIVEVRLEDGTTYRYRVTGKGAFDAEEAPVDRIIGQTPVESVTLITCTGTFNVATRQYDKRLVVRAERIYEEPAPSASLR
ncbi:MAG TPA: class F sortase [Dehalococcoidia bacterium]|nr:class F sortase [Dehalococcoidia bacterium]